MNISIVCCQTDKCWLFFLETIDSHAILLNFRFGINVLTGEIYNIEALDREKISEYYITVEAKDGGGFRTTVELNVKVTDTNDNKPLFTREAYFASLKEGATSFVRELKLEVSILIHCWINISCL